MFHRPVCFRNGPLIAFGVYGEDFRFKCFIGRDFEALPRSHLIVHHESKGLRDTSVNRNDDLSQFGFVSGFENLRARFDRIPYRWGPRRQLPVGGLRPVVCWQNHRQTVASYIDSSGVDVDTVIGRHRRGGDVQFQVVNGSMPDRDLEFGRRA